jgi:hypothetical protein
MVNAPCSRESHIEYDRARAASLQACGFLEPPSGRTRRIPFQNQGVALDLDAAERQQKAHAEQRPVEIAFVDPRRDVRGCDSAMPLAPVSTRNWMRLPSTENWPLSSAA